ncbi:GNAT family N-acetyltransferase [Rhizobium glycinendophyticum]|nr:GNAT family N-acetyltransferase [Rhizobium glycinendophyticum]
MNSNTSGMNLILVHDEIAWKAYHSIRRHVLFELRGRVDYDETLPDEFKSGHFPLLFSVGGRPVGTSRLDIASEEDEMGTLRLVAILPEYQRQGIGRAMMDEVEKFAAARGLRQLNVNAAHDAVSFYQKIGWHLVDGTRKSPLMTKTLS